MALRQLDVRGDSRPEGSPPSSQPRPRPHAPSRTQARRRTTLLVLTALSVVALVAALSTGSGAAWAAFVAVVALGATYLAGLHHLRRTSMEREFASLLDGVPDVLEPGDLVFYDTGDGAQPGHVTLYIGNGQVVTADSPGTVVKVVPLTWDGTPMGFGRVS